MKKIKIHIGDVAVVSAGQPPRGNEITGRNRAEAIARFARGESLDGLEIWYSPSFGGARLISDPAEIDYTALRCRTCGCWGGEHADDPKRGPHEFGRCRYGKCTDYDRCKAFSL